MWIWQLAKVRDNEVVSVAGLDAAVYLRVLRMMWQIFLWISVWCLAVVLPVNLSGNQVEVLLALQESDSDAVPSKKTWGFLNAPAAYDLSAFDKCSITNIPPGSRKLYAHIVSAYVVTSIVLTMLWKYNKHMTVLRLMYLASTAMGGPSHTVLVQDIPGIKYGTIPWAVKKILDGTLFRFLPKSWRRRLVRLAERIVFGGIERAWGKAMETARLAAGGKKSKAMSRWDNSSAEKSYTGHFTNFSRHTKELRRRQHETRQEQRLGVADGGVAAAGVSPAGGEAPAQGPGPEPQQAPGEADEEADQDMWPGVTPEVRAFADRLNLELDMPVKTLKVDLHAAKSGWLNVWSMAVDFLHHPAKPGEAPPTLQDMVEAEFRYVYGDAVAAVNPVWDQSELDPLFGEYTKMRTELEDYLDWATTRLRRRKKLTPKMIRVLPLAHAGLEAGSFGGNVKPVTVEALRFWPEQLRFLVSEIEAAKARARGHKATPTAFVTFNSRLAQVVSARSLHQHVEYLWRVSPAPDAHELIWRNLKMRSWERAIRTLASYGLYFGLLCSYMVPVAAIQGLIAAPKLATERRLNHHTVMALIQSVAPAIALKIFMQIVPTLLSWINLFAGSISASAMDFTAVKQFYLFQIVSLFMGSLISGSFLNQLALIINQPHQILDTLSTAIPQTSAFFINYTLIGGLAAYAVEFLRPVHLVVFLVRLPLVSTPRQRARLWADRTIKYCQNLPDNMIIFLFGMSFCIINPVMCAAVVWYFSFVLIYERFNNLYVFKRKYESGGAVWLVVFGQIMVAVYFMQCILAVVVSLRNTFMFALIVPCIVLTAAFHVVCTLAFKRPWEVLSMHDAAYLDHVDRTSRKNGSEALTDAEKAAIREMYLSPLFKTTAQEIGDLVLEAEKVRRQIAGEPLDIILRDFHERGLVRQMAAREAIDSHNLQADNDDDDDSSSGSSNSDSSSDDGPESRTGRPSVRFRGSGGGARMPTAWERAHGLGEPQAGAQRRVQRRVRFQDDIEAADGHIGGEVGPGGGGAAAASSAAGQSSWWQPQWQSWKAWNAWWGRAAAQALPAKAGGTVPAATVLLRGSGDGSAALPTGSTATAAPEAGGRFSPGAERGPGSAAVARPESALALVSALVSHVSAMDEAERQQLQSLLQASARSMAEAPAPSAALACGTSAAAAAPGSTPPASATQHQPQQPASGGTTTAWSWWTSRSGPRQRRRDGVSAPSSS